ncbi:MAG: polysaccharide biosynthesis protein [Hyphomicrobiales bacterium]|nr:polysaccharide biosynthesis protein [Hyphomicrobiales bacterium]
MSGGVSLKTAARKRLEATRYGFVLAHDAIFAAFAFWMAAVIVLPIPQFMEDAAVVTPFACFASVASVSISRMFGVFSTRWRLASLTDFISLIKSAVVLAIFLLLARQAFRYFHVDQLFLAELRVICLGAILTLGSQAGGRIAFRYYHFLRRRKAIRTRAEVTIFIGDVSESQGALRAAEQGMLSAHIVACLLPRGNRKARTIRTIPVLGTTDDLDYAVNQLAAGGQAVTSVLLSAGMLNRGEEAQALKRMARRLGLTLLKIETVAIGGRAEVRFEDFLFRRRRRIDHRPIGFFVSGRTLLITGGGGTIGGDIAMRAAAHGAALIVLLDIAELGLQTRLARLRQDYPSVEARAVLCNVRDATRLNALVARIRPDVLVHAAALKHVDLVEDNWQEAVCTNVFGTANVLEAAERAAVPAVVNISTDKAADPVGMLGFTKRAGEALVVEAAQRSRHRRYSVRFGNVLGSSGSVLEVFLAQIAAGGPITLTDPAVMRYFMSRDEAAELVLAAGSLTDDAPLYLLDMGDPILIRDLAIEVIEWAGFTPHEDIAIVTTGLRPGERLEEVLVSQGEMLSDTTIHGIAALQRPTSAPLDLHRLRDALEADDKAAVIAALALLPEERFRKQAVGA